MAHRKGRDRARHGKRLRLNPAEVALVALAVLVTVVVLIAYYAR
ncbi:hypothetical protein OIE13_06150 [Streptosporangium sp. NBC_01810]|nr:hypothetical protein [Streptosporangium sp. NBC_01810]WSA27456.1 hypothetical protein OIE13_06150 [Streptosporangium sp. NBC_01810]